jgi:hypothetical protein
MMTTITEMQWQVRLSGLCTTRSNGETSDKHSFIASGQPKDDFNAAIPSAMERNIK